MAWKTPTAAGPRSPKTLSSPRSALPAPAPPPEVVEPRLVRPQLKLCTSAMPEPRSSSNCGACASSKVLPPKSSGPDPVLVARSQEALAERRRRSSRCSNTPGARRTVPAAERTAAGAGRVEVERRRDSVRVMAGPGCPGRLQRDCGGDDARQRPRVTACFVSIRVEAPTSASRRKGEATMLTRPLKWPAREIPPHPQRPQPQRRQVRREKRFEGVRERRGG